MVQEAYTQEQKEHALNARLAFNAHDYVTCHSVMVKLAALRKDDPTVMHNKSVVEFVYTSQHKCSDEFEAKLRSLAGPENSDLGLKYNLALCQFYQRQYTQAEQTLISMLPNGSLVNPTKSAKLNQKVQLLYLDTLLARGQPKQVLDLTDQLMANSEPLEVIHVFRLRAALLLGLIDLALEEQAVIKDQSTVVKFLSAQLEHLRGHRLQALEDISQVQDCYPALASNNIALIHARAYKYQLAGLHLKRAAEHTDRFCGDIAPRSRVLQQHVPIKAFSVCQHHALLYNISLQQISANKPQEAFNGLLKLTKIFPLNPRLWYRLAECAVRVQNPDRLHEWRAHSQRGLLEAAFGQGAQRKLILQPDSECSTGVDRPWLETDSLPAPTMEFAILCLRNVLDLLTNQAEQDMRPHQAPFTESGQTLLWTGTLILGAFVALQLHNPVEALELANQVLARPGLSERACKAHRYYASLYAAEAQFLCKQYRKAFNHLNMTVFTSLFDAGAFSAGARGPMHWSEWQLAFPLSQAQGEAVVLINATCCLALMQSGGAGDEDLAKAGQLLKKASEGLIATAQNTLPLSYILTALFVTLARQDAPAAVKILRTNFAHVAWKDRMFHCHNTDAPL